MTDIKPEDAPEAPSTDEIQYALQTAVNLQNEVDHYRTTATAIDEQFESRNDDRRLSLDDMPYGEELIRTREFPKNLEQAITLLTNVEQVGLSPTEATELFQKAEAIIEDVRSTLDDCQALPPEDEDEDN